MQREQLFMQVPPTSFLLFPFLGAVLISNHFKFLREIQTAPYQYINPVSPRGGLITCLQLSVSWVCLLGLSCAAWVSVDRCPPTYNGGPTRSFQRCRTCNQSGAHCCVTWLVHVCAAKTCSCVYCYDLFMCVLLWLVHVCAAMTL